MRPRWTISARIIVPGLLACVIWSFCNVANKVVLDQGVPPLTLLLGQLLVSAPMLWLVVILQGKRVPIKDASRLLRLGIWQPGLAYGASYIGLTMTTVTVEALLFSIETLLIIYFAWVFLGERPHRITIFAGILGSMGIPLIAGIGSSETDMAGLLGAALILLGVLGAAFYSILLKREVVKSDAISVIAVAQTGGLVIVGLIWLAWPTPDRLANLSVETALLIGLSGVFMHSIAFVLFAKQMQTMEASTASLLLLSIPVMTMILGYLILGERLTALQIVGAIIVLSAMLLQTASTKQAAVSSDAL